MHKWKNVRVNKPKESEKKNMHINRNWSRLVDRSASFLRWFDNVLDFSIYILCTVCWVRFTWKKNWNSFGAVYVFSFSLRCGREMWDFSYSVFVDLRGFEWLKRDGERENDGKKRRAYSFLQDSRNQYPISFEETILVYHRRKKPSVEVGEKEEEKERVLNNVRQANKSIVLCELLQIGILYFAIPL